MNADLFAAPTVAITFIPSVVALRGSFLRVAATDGLRSASARRALRRPSVVPRFRPIHRDGSESRRKPVACTAPNAPNATSSPPPASPSPSSPLLVVLSRVSGVVTTLFPVWTVLASLIALRRPALFLSLTAPWVVQLSLSLLMLSMGLTLRPSELLSAMKRPGPLVYNMCACYIVMPALALLIAKLFALSGTVRAGLILLSIVSGGQASNLCTHIAGGDVALSVTMTTMTTVAAAVALPSLSGALLGTSVAVDAGKLALSTAQVTLAPIAVGVTMRAVAPRPVAAVQTALPALGVVTVVVLVLGPVSQCAQRFAAASGALLAPVMMLHVVGGLVGFLPIWLGGADWRTALTVAFETGFKSPALGFVLASRCFPPGVELASVVSIVTLAPMAALCAVMIRAMTRGRVAGKVAEIGR